MKNADVLETYDKIIKNFVLKGVRNAATEQEIIKKIRDILDITYPNWDLILKDGDQAILKHIQDARRSEAERDNG